MYKLPIRIGLLTAILFEALAWSFVLGTCLRAPADCHEYGFFMYFIELPTIYIAGWFLNLAKISFSAYSQNAVSIFEVVMFIVVGFVQYFIFGWLVGWMVVLIKRVLVRRA